MPVLYINLLLNFLYNCTVHPSAGKLPLYLYCTPSADILPLYPFLHPTAVKFNNLYASTVHYMLLNYLYTFIDIPLMTMSPTLPPLLCKSFLTTTYYRFFFINFFHNRKQLSTGEELFILDRDRFICKDDFNNIRAQGRVRSIKHDRLYRFLLLEILV